MKQRKIPFGTKHTGNKEGIISDIATKTETKNNIKKLNKKLSETNVVNNRFNNGENFLNGSTNKPPVTSNDSHKSNQKLRKPSCDPIIPAATETGNAVILKKAKVWTTNAESIANKWNEFKMRIQEEKPDIIGITESWCKTNQEDRMYISNEYLQLDNYIMLRKDSMAYKGGILMYIHKDIHAEEYVNPHNVQDALWCRIKADGICHIIGCIYRKGTSSEDNNNSLRESINHAKSEHENVLLFGDFNLPNIDWTTNTTRNGNEV